MPDRTPAEILDLLIGAAGNADAVRLAWLIREARTAGAETFTRDNLVHRWSATWPRHLTLPRQFRPEQRVNRSLPVLISVEAISDLQGPTAMVTDPVVLNFLADRAYMSAALEIQHPLSNTLPVGDATRAAAAAALGLPSEPEPDEPGPEDPVATPDTDRP